MVNERSNTDGTRRNVFHAYRHDIHAQIDAILTGVRTLDYVQSRKTFYQNRDSRFQLSFGGFDSETEKQETPSGR